MKPRYTMRIGYFEEALGLYSKWYKMEHIWDEQTKKFVRGDGTPLNDVLTAEMLPTVFVDNARQKYKKGISFDLDRLNRESIDYDWEVLDYFMKEA